MNIPLALGFVALFSGGLGFFLGKVGISNGVYIYRIKAKGTNETITKFNRLAVFK